MKRFSVAKGTTGFCSRSEWLIAALLSVVLNLGYSSQVAATELLNSSFDVSRELFAALNPGFKATWDAGHPKDPITIKQSHGGSSKQALAILQGLNADVVTYNQVSDIDILHNHGQLLPTDWQQRLPNNSSPFYSTMAFLVRKDNPKGIKDWSDLLRDDVKVVFPNPKTSGNGRYTYLAAWGAFAKSYPDDKDEIRNSMSRLVKNVVVFDTGGRGATTSFVERGQGDVLITFESEVNNIRQQYGKEQYQVIVPTTNILAEFPVAWLDKNVKKKGTASAAKAYLNYLYTPQAQRVITTFNYRVYDPQAMAEAAARFPAVTLFRVETLFGNWTQVMSTHFANGGEWDRILVAGRD